MNETKTEIFTVKQITENGSWVASNGDAWTGKYYATKKGAEKAANKANFQAGLI